MEHKQVIVLRKDLNMRKGKMVAQGARASMRAILNLARREGDVYYTLLGRAGLYNAQVVRQEMGGVFADVKLPDHRAVEPAFEFAEV